jgi:hypothetical protein
VEGVHFTPTIEPIETHCLCQGPRSWKSDLGAVQAATNLTGSRSGFRGPKKTDWNGADERIPEYVIGRDHRRNV